MNVTVILTAALMSACAVSAQLMDHDWSHNNSHLWNTNVVNGRREVARRVEFVPFPLLQTLTDHNSFVNSVAFSNDGTRIVSGSWDDTVKIWDAENGGAALHTLSGHTNSVNSVAFSNDGTRIVSGDDDDTIKIWDAQNGGAALQTLSGHTSFVSSVGFNNDGTRIVSGSGDYTVKIWDAQNGGAALHTLVGHTNSVNSVAFDNDGTRIVSGSSDSTIKIWGLAPVTSPSQTLSTSNIVIIVCAGIIFLVIGFYFGRRCIKPSEVKTSKDQGASFVDNAGTGADTRAVPESALHTQKT